MWYKTKLSLPDQNKLVLGLWDNEQEHVYRLCYRNEFDDWLHPLNGQGEYECCSGHMRHDFDDHPNIEWRKCHILHSALTVTAPDWWMEIPKRTEELDIADVIDKCFAGWSKDDEYGGPVKPNCEFLQFEEMKELVKLFYELGARMSIK